jgi:LacI family transcriptional regulator
MKVGEIAARLSLSPGTVSKALRGKHGQVSLATTQRVLEFCHQNGYLSRSEVDKTLFRMQARSTGKKVFCLTCYEGLWGYDAVFHGISEQMQGYGQYTSFFSVNDRSSLQNFPSEQASTVIILGRVSPETFDYFSEAKVPIVLVDNRIDGWAQCTVNSDNLESVAKAVEVLAEKGHKRIAFLCRHEDMPRKTYNLHQRQSGYIVGITNAGLHFDPELMVTSYAPNNMYGPIDFDTTVEELRALAERFFSMTPMPTAAVAANDLTAHVLRSVLREKGLRVPEDVSIIGYDGQHRIPGVGSKCFEPVSTMVVKWEQMGQEAVDLAVERLANGQPVEKHVLVPTEYEDTGTVAPPRQ